MKKKFIDSNALGVRMSESEKSSEIPKKIPNQSAQKSSGLVYYTPKDALFPYEIEEFLEDRHRALVAANLIPIKLANETETSQSKTSLYKDIIDIPEDEIVKYFPYTFCQYLKEKYYNIQDLKVIADFSGMYIHNMDMVKVDFSEVIFSKCNFQICNFEGCKFRDADLSEVYFFDTNLKGVDFRGSNLSEIRFLGYEIENPDESADNKDRVAIAKLESIKLSSSEAVIRKSLQNNNTIRNNFCSLRENRIAEQILNIEERINNRITDIDLSNKENSRGLFNSKNRAPNQDREYDNLLKQRSNLEKKRIELSRIKTLEDAHSCLGDNIPYNTSPSMINILDSKPIFYPFYLKDIPPYASDKTSPLRIQMNRADIEHYLKLNGEISLNDYAQNLAIKRNIKISDSGRVIADLSSGDPDNKTDLSSMVFKNIDFSRACFAGANLSNSQFLNCNLERSIFDGADFVSASFINCNARASHFFEANLNSSYIHGSNFSRANMIGINADKASVDSSNFNFANIRNSSWYEAKIENSNFNQADFYHAYFLKAHLYMVQMQYSIIENAMFNQCEIEKCDFQHSFAIKSEFMYSNISFSVFNGIKASRLNMSHSNLGTYVSFSGGVLKYGYLKKLKATKVKFNDCDLEEANLSNAKLVKTSFENSNLKFSFFSNSTMEGCNASNADISSAYLDNSKITDVNFQKATARDVYAQKSKLILSNFSSADLRGANFENAVLTKSNLESSYLENARFNFANLEGASLNLASFNTATDFIDTNMGIGIGKLFKVNAQGNKESVSIETITSNAKLLHKAENYSKVLKSIGDIISYFAHALYKSDSFIQHPFKSYSKFIALINFIAFGIVAYIIVMIEMNLNRYSETEELLPAILMTFLGGVVGFFIGYRITSILGISSIIIAIIGAFAASWIGAIVALFGACATGYALKHFTYKSLDEYISYILHKFSKNLKKISGIIGLTEEQKRIIKEKQDAISSHIPVRNKTISDSGHNYAREYDILEVKRQNFFYAFKEGKIDEFTVNDINEELKKLRPEYKHDG